MSIDFRADRSYPRRGRMPLGGMLWLARVYDKARAAAAGLLGDYVYPCPIDRGMFERWGVTMEAFDCASRAAAGDDDIRAWLLSQTTGERIAAANSWVVVEMFENLDRQDREEGAFDATAREPQQLVSP